MVKRLLISSIFIVFVSLLGYSQKYSSYFEKGKSYYNSKNYFSAFEQFVLAKEFAKTELQMADARKWQNWSKNKVLEQQRLVGSTVKNVETILRYTLKSSDYLNGGQTKLYKLCKNKGEIEYKNRNFFDAYNYFRFSKLSPDYQRDVEVEANIPKSKAALKSLKKIALLIGNSKYPRQRLPKAEIDAKDLALKLKSIGFKVTLALNVKAGGFSALIADFIKASKNYDIVLFYFSGYSFQSDILLPIDIAQRENLKSKFSVNFLMSNFPKNDSKKVFILDVDRSIQKGTVSSVMAYDNFIVCHSTSPNQKAFNGRGRNALFTQHLLEEIAKPNVPFQELFRKIRASTMKSSGNDQVPTIYDNLQHNLYLNWKIE
jgi:hypothetical protein